MTLPPEAQILIINAAILLVAYLGIYPTMRPLTAVRIMRADLAVSGLALGLAGALFWGTGARFSLVFVTVNWFWFSLITMLAIEMPLFAWFARRHGIDGFGPDA